MGIPAARDITNLYMSYFDNTFAYEFLLYKRYIDNVFSLVEADSKKGALEQYSKVHADGLTLMVSEGENCQLS